MRQTRAAYAVELNQATLPRLLVNRRYYQELRSGPQDKESRAWLSECLASASWLVKALDQRARTIVKVVSEIVKRQQGFFEQGVAAMKPMTLREIAEAIEMHEFDGQPGHLEQISALRSRPVRAEIFLRLRRRLDRRRGEGAAAEAVKAAIRDIIDGETEVLSDDAIAGLSEAARI